MHTKASSARRAPCGDPKPATVIVKMILRDCIRGTEKVVDVEVPTSIYARMQRGK